MRGKLYFLTTIVTALVIVNGFFAFSSSRLPNLEGVFAKQTSTTRQAYIFPIVENSFYPLLDSNVIKPEISAKSALIFDPKTSKFLFSKNEKEKLPIASLTKIMTAVVVLENLNTKEVVSIPQESIKVDGLKQDLFISETLSVEDLMKIMLVSSSNDAAYALAIHAKNRGIDLVAKMNIKTKELEMVDTNFLDPAGLNDQGFSTVRDLVKLVDYALKYNQIWDVLAQPEISIKSQDGKVIHEVKNTNQLLGVIPDIMGGKTGYTDRALGCMVLIIKVPNVRDEKIISVVLGSSDRFGESKTIVDWVFRAYKWQ